MRRGLAIVATTVVVNLTAFGGQPAPPAIAAPNCPAGHVCTWSGSDFTGTMTDYGPDKFGPCYPGTFGSVQNATMDRTVHVYSTNSCAGGPASVGPGQTSTTGGEAIHVA